MQKITNQQTKHIPAILVFVDWPWARVLFWCLAAAAAKSLQSCPTLCDPIDGSPPGSAAPGILQARTLERVAISFSSGWKWNVKVKLLSCVQLFETSWMAADQAPLSMGFSRQEYWSGVPLPSRAQFPVWHPAYFLAVSQHWKYTLESNNLWTMEVEWTGCSLWVELQNHTRNYEAFLKMSS